MPKNPKSCAEESIVLKEIVDDEQESPLLKSESVVELKSLLKLIDNVIESAPATDDDDSPVKADQSNPFLCEVPIQNNENRRPKRNQSDHSQKQSSGDGGDGKVMLTETLMVPVKKYPKYNFVGRILGPRGMTVKQLERETGCKIFVHGRASSTTFNPHTKATRSPFNLKATLSTISQSALTDDPLHVYIECLDYPESGKKKMAHAVAIVNELLSPPVDGKDELKRQQLVDISLINGTYRPTSISNDITRPLRRSQWGQSVDPTSNPADLELKPLRKELGGTGRAQGDFGVVYGIAQQKRIWQKPRGPDTSSEEYAKSVSSREYVSDIVNKNKNSPVKSSKGSSDDSLYQLPQSVVSETLKVAMNLLASHKHMAYSHQPEERREFDDGKSGIPRISALGSGDAPGEDAVAHDYPHQMAPPPPLMHHSNPYAAPPFSTDLYFPAQMPSPYSDFPPGPPLYYMFPPPPPAHFNPRHY